MQKQTLRHRLTPIHTWTGLVASWLLFVIFFAGTISVFRTELDIWFKPELPLVEPQPATQSLQQAVDFLQKTAPSSREWYIVLPTERMPFSFLFWRSDDENGQAWLSPAGIVEPRETEGGGFFTEFHHELYYIPAQWAYWLIMLLSVVALAAIIAGVIIHKRILTDFFTLRRKQGLKSWLDMHNVLSVLPLPFHLMIIYTGVVLIGMHGVMTYGAEKVLGSTDPLYEEAVGIVPQPEHAGNLQPLGNLLPLWNKVDDELGQQKIRSLTVQYPNREQAQVVFEIGAARQVSAPYAYRVYRVADQQLLAARDHNSTMGKMLGGSFRLHLATYADYPVLWLYFILGLAGSGMIATGSIIWIAKRRERKNPPLRAIWWVERLNIAVFVGFPLACVSYFYANRLLPIELEMRAEWEIHTLFLVWLVAILCSFLPVANLAQIAKRGLKLTACALFFVPLLDVWIGRPFWFSLWHWDTLYLSLELACLLLGILWWQMAQKLEKK